MEQEATHTSSKISDIIEYDVDVLKNMEVKDLLLQQVCFLHLSRPKRKWRLDAQKFHAEAVFELQKVIAELKSSPLTAPFAPPVQAILDRHLANKPVEP